MYSLFCHSASLTSHFHPVYPWKYSLGGLFILSKVVIAQVTGVDCPANIQDADPPKIS